MNGCFVLLSYIELALDRTIVQRSNLVCLESDVGAIEWMLFYICLSVCLYVCPMYFNYIAYFVHMMSYYVGWDHFALVF